MDGLAREAPRPIAEPIAEVVSHRVEGDLHRSTRAALTARARRLGRALAAAGLVPGDRVATLAWNGHRHLELALAAAGAGMVLQALDPRQHPDGIVRIIGGAGARMVFFDLSFMPFVEEIAPRLSGVRSFVALTDRASMPGPDMIPNLLCYEDLVAGAAADAAPAFAVTPFALPAFAPPFGAVEAAEAPAGPAGAGPALFPGDTILAAVPMFRAEGWSLVHRALAAGARLVLPGPWLDGGSLRALIEREGVTVAAADAPAWHGVLAHAEDAGLPLPPLRLVLAPDAADPRLPARPIHRIPRAGAATLA